MVSLYGWCFCWVFGGTLCTANSYEWVCLCVCIQYVVVYSEIQGKTCGRAGTCPAVHYSRFSRFSILNFKDEYFSWLTGPGVSSNRKRNIQKKKKLYRKYIVAVYWLLRSMKINGAYEKQRTIIFLKPFHKQKTANCLKKERNQVSSSVGMFVVISKRVSLLTLPPPGQHRNTECLLSFIGCDSESRFLPKLTPWWETNFPVLKGHYGQHLT